VTGDAGELRLEAIAGNAAGFTIVVADRLVIGRQSEGPGKLADDPELSRHHAEIALGADGQFTITDLASTNGTFVNGTQLDEPAQLALGDEIEVGGTKLVVRAVPDAAPPPPVDVRAATVIVDFPPATGEPAEAPTPPAAVQEPPPPPPPEPEPKPVLVRLTVDFDAEAAKLAVESDAEPIRLELADGQWRVADGGA
jgi:pSer/pThr/pTyr-binding forkhead associated (FHA) protein